MNEWVGITLRVSHCSNFEQTLNGRYKGVEGREKYLNVYAQGLNLDAHLPRFPGVGGAFAEFFCVGT